MTPSRAPARRRPSAPPRRRARRRRAALAVAALLVLGGGYALGDAADVVPGPLTTAPPPDPDPWPAAPGAELPPALPGDPVLAAAGTDAPVPDPAVLADVVAPFLGDPALGPSRAALVTDGLTGEVLLDVGADAALEPASTVKLLTAAAALAELDPAATFPTTVVLTDAGAETPTAVLLADGDNFLSAGAGDPGAVVGHAGLADLADDVAASLAARGTGALALRLADPLAPTGPVRPPGWLAVDVANGYAADVTGVAVNGGRLLDEEYSRRAADPGLAATDRLADLLRERGVDVAGDPARVDPAAVPDDAPVLGEVSSAPVADVVGHMLRVSDNTSAELLGLLVARERGAPVTPVGAAQAITDAVADLGVDVTGVALPDGSGLGDGGRLTPRAIAGVLEVAVQDEAFRPLLAGLPVAGLTGSLTDRLVDDPTGRGVVRAKTGSLFGVTSLAGVVVDADGRLLVFALSADQITSTPGARAAFDDVAGALAGCGCR
ncbi:D-alanyl-D-alanine carboxypeptidase/D-alanyl-D-alanine endopeptidase [Pseudokineococcus sp. 1T1Z-3]|uniref:D-alanyl-D-alanine carboxypeptidase/D-alanyl-D-alanine endopeptidase n=1 Tax=Pseudokineococcus sp. 1T1Z-3 TaxID=3132745 RepID=UPI0030AC2C78